MSRFVDRSAVHRIDLGPCGCPKTPHESDWVEVRTAYSGSDWATFFQGNTARSMVRIVAAWNLADDDGDVVAINAFTLDALDKPTFDAIDDWIGENVEPPTVPNASSEPSPGGSQERRSPRQKTKANGSSTTPSWQPAGASATSTTPPPSS